MNEVMQALLWPALFLDVVPEKAVEEYPFLSPDVSIKTRLVRFERIQFGLSDKTPENLLLASATFAIAILRDRGAFDRIRTRLRTSSGNTEKIVYLDALASLVLGEALAAEAAFLSLMSSSDDDALVQVAALAYHYCLRLGDNWGRAIEFSAKQRTDNWLPLARVAFGGSTAAAYLALEKYELAIDGYQNAARLCDLSSFTKLGSFYSQAASSALRLANDSDRFPEVKDFAKHQVQFGRQYTRESLLAPILEETISSLMDFVSTPENSSLMSSTPREVMVSLEALSRSFGFYGLVNQAVHVERIRAQSSYLYTVTNAEPDASPFALEAAILSGDVALTDRILGKKQFSPFAVRSNRVRFIQWIVDFFKEDVPVTSGPHLAALNAIPACAEFLGYEETKDLVRSLNRLPEFPTSMDSTKDWGRALLDARVALKQNHANLPSCLNPLKNGNEGLLWKENFFSQIGRVPREHLTEDEREAIWVYVRDTFTQGGQLPRSGGYVVLAEVVKDRLPRDQSAISIVNEFVPRAEYRDFLAVALSANGLISELRDDSRGALEKGVLSTLTRLTTPKDELRRTEGMSLAGFDNLHVVLAVASGWSERFIQAAWSLTGLLLRDKGLPLSKTIDLWKNIVRIIELGVEVPADVLSAARVSANEFARLEEEKLRLLPQQTVWGHGISHVEIWAEANRVLLALDQPMPKMFYQDIIKYSFESENVREQTPIFWLMRDLLKAKSSRDTKSLFPAVVRLAFSSNPMGRQQCALIAVALYNQYRHEGLEELIRRLSRDAVSSVRQSVARGLAEFEDLDSTSVSVDIRKVLEEDDSFVVRNGLRRQGLRGR